jgi:hypothetical protein
MGWFDGDSNESQAYNEVRLTCPSIKLRALLTFFQYQNTPDEHKAKISHELIGGAAAFEVNSILLPHCKIDC